MRLALEAGSNGHVLRRGPEHWLLLAAAGLALAGFLAFGFFIEPSADGSGTHEKLGLPPCMTMEVLGVPCPGCGVTTSVALASRGRITESFINQPFGLFTALVGALLIPWALWGHFRGRDLWVELRRLVGKRVLIASTLLMLGAWIWKLYRVLGPVA